MKIPKTVIVQETVTIEKKVKFFVSDKDLDPNAVVTAAREKAYDNTPNYKSWKVVSKEEPIFTVLAED